MGDSLKCKFCEKEATVHLTQIINNKIHKVDLCETCAQKKGVSGEQGFSLAEMIMQPNFEDSGDDTELKCPSCNFSTSDFRRTGRLGCASCYQTFRPLLEPVLEDMHSGLKHTGKIPTHSLNRMSKELKIQNLREALRRAITDEAYENAANLRDQIQTLENETESEALEKLNDD